MNDKDVVAVIADLLDKWQQMETWARHLCPDATEDEILEKTKALMDLAIKTVMERHGNA